MNEKLKQAEEFLHAFGEAKYREGRLWRGWGWISASRARNKEKQLLSLISQLIEENEIAKKKHAWMKTITKLKEDEQKAFWWASEFTDTLHNNNIQKAWEDYKKIKRQKALDELTALSQEMGDYD